MRSKPRRRPELIGRIYTVFAILLIITLYNAVFRLSAMPADQSALQSTTVARRLTEVLEALLSIDLPFNNSSVQLNELDGFVRKAAHFAEYALLGLLSYSIAVCWNHIENQGITPVPSFLFVLALAAADEIHQTYVPGRSGSLKDVLLDSAGILTGVLILKICDGIYTRHRLKKGKTP